MSTSFVEHFLAHTRFYESPGSFWRWAAYSAIGSVMRDNCYRQLGDQRIYPNLYILLLADSAVHRKGHPIKLCEDLVKVVKSTKVISGRSSIQGILDELARGEIDKQTGKILAGGSAIFFASELSAGIVNDPEAVKILTDIYDFKAEYTSRLRGSGIFRIKNICFSLFAASNEELLRDVYDVKAIFGGLLGRTFLVKPNEFRPANSLFEIRDTTESLQGLEEKLGRIARLKGEFEIPEETKKIYEDWYKPFRQSYQNKADRSGITGRIHTSILKLAMVICVDRTEQLVILPDHMRESITHCIMLLPNYQGFVMSSGKSTVSEIGAALIEAIWKSQDKRISKADFLSVHFHNFDHEGVDKCIMTMSQAGLVQTGLDTKTGVDYYMITDKCREKFNLKEEGK